jgi:hypothetical protein
MKAAKSEGAGDGSIRKSKWSALSLAGAVTEHERLP